MCERSLSSSRCLFMPKKTFAYNFELDLSLIQVLHVLQM